MLKNPRYFVSRVIQLRDHRLRNRFSFLHCSSSGAGTACIAPPQNAHVSAMPSAPQREHSHAALRSTCTDSAPMAGAFVSVNSVNGNSICTSFRFARFRGFSFVLCACNRSFEFSTGAFVPFQPVVIAVFTRCAEVFHSFHTL